MGYADVSWLNSCYHELIPSHAEKYHVFLEIILLEIIILGRINLYYFSAVCYNNTILQQ